jgi:hypothetical protein
MIRIKRNKKGQALLEVLLAGMILSVVLVAFLQGLNVTLLGTARDVHSNTALHVAQSQMELIKSLPFNGSACDESTSPPYEKIHDLPENYDVEVTIDPDPLGAYGGNCTPLQLITVTVSYNNENLASQDHSVVLQDYKVNR